MGVTRVGTVCVVLCSGVEERRVRGTGGACRSGGDRGVEPTDIYLRVQLLRGCFNVVQRSRNRTRIRTRNGAIGAPAMPAAPGELRKAQAARRRRQKDAYALLTKHLLHKEHLQHITQNFFQDGRAAYNYLDNALSHTLK